MKNFRVTGNVWIQIDDMIEAESEDQARAEAERKAEELANSVTWTNPDGWDCELPVCDDLEVEELEEE